MDEEFQMFLEQYMNDTWFQILDQDDTKDLLKEVVESLRLLNKIHASGSAFTENEYKLIRIAIQWSEVAKTSDKEMRQKWSKKNIRLSRGYESSADVFLSNWMPGEQDIQGAHTVSGLGSDLSLADTLGEDLAVVMNEKEEKIIAMMIQLHDAFKPGKKEVTTQERVLVQDISDNMGEMSARRLIYYMTRCIFEPKTSNWKEYELDIYDAICELADLSEDK